MPTLNGEEYQMGFQHGQNTLLTRAEQEMTPHKSGWTVPKPCSFDIWGTKIHKHIPLLSGNEEQATASKMSCYLLLSHDVQGQLRWVASYKQAASPCPSSLVVSTFYFTDNHSGHRSSCHQEGEVTGNASDAEFLVVTRNTRPDKRKGSNNSLRW